VCFTFGATPAPDRCAGRGSAQREQPHDPPLDRGGEGVLSSSSPYRIPQAQLLASLRGNHDLAGELAELDERFAEVTEEQVRAALADSE
jgi:hypothetical protein